MGGEIQGRMRSSVVFIEVKKILPYRRIVNLIFWQMIQTMKPLYVPKREKLLERESIRSNLGCINSFLRVNSFHFLPPSSPPLAPPTTRTDVFT